MAAAAAAAATSLEQRQEGLRGCVVGRGAMSGCSCGVVGAYAEAEVWHRLKIVLSPSLCPNVVSFPCNAWHTIFDEWSGFRQTGSFAGAFLAN